MKYMFYVCLINNLCIMKYINLKYSLKERLKDNKMSAMQLATKIDVHLMTVYSWLRLKKGEPKSIPADKLREIAVILDCRMEDIYNKINAPQA